MRRSRTILHRIPGLLAALVLLPAAAVAADEPVLQTEESDVIRLDAPTPHRILVQDAVARHSKDGRVYVVDADRGALLGMVQAAYNANVVADPKGRAFYVAETVWSRGNRGDRADLLASYDPRSLEIVDDLVLPGRALVTPKKNDLAISNDGGRIYVYDMVPGNAVHVVDTATHKVTGHVDIPGCALVYPWGNDGFSSICGDGSLVNVSLAGAAPQVTHSKPFFDPDRDPVFEHSPTRRSDGKVWFISYTGLVTPVALSADPRIEPSWSIQQAAGLKPPPGGDSPFTVAWRPGGWQLSALHAASGHLFVLMHEGTFWTHKIAGTEVWELDVATRKLIRRIRLAHPSTLVGVTQDAHPLLFTADDTGAFYIRDAETAKELRTIRHLGDDLYFTVAPGE